MVGSPEAGDGAALAGLPAGWRSQARTSSPFRLIVLDGEPRAGDVPARRYGYVSAVPGERMPVLSAAGPALVFVDAIADVRAHGGASV